jgi:hypothetical protein
LGLAGRARLAEDFRSRTEPVLAASVCWFFGCPQVLHWFGSPVRQSLYSSQSAIAQAERGTAS